MAHSSLRFGLEYPIPVLQGTDRRIGNIADLNDDMSSYDIFPSLWIELGYKLKVPIEFAADFSAGYMDIPALNIKAGLKVGYCSSINDKIFFTPSFAVSYRYRRILTDGYGHGYPLKSFGPNVHSVIAGASILNSFKVRNIKLGYWIGLQTENLYFRNTYPGADHAMIYGKRIMEFEIGILYEPHFSHRKPRG